ncbi:PSD1 and planctomycete cytochrome C domain-containing protein [Verrucomicrobiaceae bacterium 227]
MLRHPIPIPKSAQPLVALTLLAGTVPASADEAAGLEFFETHIRPLFVEHCHQCHSADAKKLKANLYLDSRAGWETGGVSGPAIVPGDPEQSLLIHAVSHTNDDLKMPPKTRLSELEIGKLKTWINMGAPDPREGQVKRPNAGVDLEKGREFWAFKPPLDHPVPTVKNTSWPANDIDHYILARLEEAQLAPAEDAPRRTLLRRIYYDLIGLPPSPEEMNTFLADKSPTAFAKVVDHLLARPEFGERWGRHWLDVTRYAESSGGGRSLVFPDAWRFRDYVIGSFNQDKPYNQLVLEHLAGDILEHHSVAQRNDQLIGSGYLVLGALNYELQDHELLRMEFVDEQIDTVGRTFLGMTLGCARCHDHKFDPIPTSDYYALAGIFLSTESMGQGSAASGVTSFATTQLDVNNPDEITQRQASLNALTKEIAALKKLPKEQQAPRLKTLETQRKAIAEKLKTLQPKTMAPSESKSPADDYVRIRGQVRNKGEKVPRGFLSVAMKPNTSPAIAAHSSGRLELARWIADSNNPLTSRVMANRIWKYLLGEGLVRTPDNFGGTGELPSHPELLDHLALQFTNNGWSIKSLIREIVLSRTYQLSSLTDSNNDPENRLLGRAHRKRFEAESIRDTALLVSRKLDSQRGGNTLRNPGQYDLNYKFNTNRRSIYVPWFRNSMLDLFEVFDAPNPNLVVGKRPVTNLPTQALFLMNSSFIHEQSQLTAKRLIQEQATIDHAYQLILCRPPSESELASIENFLRQFEPSEQEEAWTQICQTLFACVDFRFLD